MNSRNKPRPERGRGRIDKEVRAVTGEDRIIENLGQAADQAAEDLHNKSGLVLVPTPSSVMLALYLPGGCSQQNVEFIRRTAEHAIQAAVGKHGSGRVEIPGNSSANFHIAGFSHQLLDLQIASVRNYVMYVGLIQGVRVKTRRVRDPEISETAGRRVTGTFSVPIIEKDFEVGIVSNNTEFPVEKHPPAQIIGAVRALLQQCLAKCYMAFVTKDEWTDTPPAMADEPRFAFLPVPLVSYYRDKLARRGALHGAEIHGYQACGELLVTNGDDIMRGLPDVTGVRVDTVEQVAPVPECRVFFGVRDVSKQGFPEMPPDHS